MSAYTRTVLSDTMNTSATCGRPITLDVEIRKGSSRATRWLLRDLEGNWLMESMTPGLISAHCDPSMGVCVGAAINTHELYTSIGNEGDDEP